MWVQILIGLLVALAAVLAPVLPDQEPHGPDEDVFNSLPRVMSPGPEGAADVPSLEGTLVAYASASEGDGSAIRPIALPFPGGKGVLPAWRPLLTQGRLRKSGRLPSGAQGISSSTLSAIMSP